MRMKKDLEGLTPSFQDSYQFKYSFKDWTIEDIRKIVFPTGREFFNPVDEKLIQKWNATDWTNNEYLSFLTVEELKRLEAWLEEHEQKKGLINA
jgi:hypothetical protein